RRACTLRYGPAFCKHHRLQGRADPLGPIAGGIVMAKISVELAKHLEHEITTLCHCWRVTRGDGAVMGFTDHDRRVTCDGTVFMPETGLSGSEARHSFGLAVDTMDVEGALSSLDISESDIVAGLYDGATVETLLV